MRKYIKDNRIINATDKAYRLLYKPVGFKPYANQRGEIVAPTDMTVAEIKEELDRLDVEYTTRDTKDILLSKLEEVGD